ncbi:MAG: hypothetical protein MSF32_07460 [Dysosmobacter sp.]|nr:hypothetical protein [Dysosmobacter sp.]
MKKQRVLALLLGLTLLCTAVIPSVFAADGDSSNNGMVINKTATANNDGSYTIQLEAYATGSKIISEVTEDIPTDIVLVLDQSGSMDDPIGTVSFEPYEDEYAYHTRNQDYYKNRHNGGKANLYYPLGNDVYASVSVTVVSDPTYENASGHNNSYYYSNRSNLYEKVGEEEYKEVSVTRNGWGTSFNPYEYTYTFYDDTSITSTGANTSPDLSNRAPLYIASIDTDQNVYTYTYTDADGEHIIGTSTGATTRPTFGEGENKTALYQKVVIRSGKSKLDALQDAVTTFVKNVSEKAKGSDRKAGTSDDVDHRIAIVGFASTASWGTYENTELLSTQNVVNYGSATNANYQDALVSVNTNGSLNSRLSTAINRLDASGDTYLEYGMDMANRIFAQYPIASDDTSGRQRVVVVFTDGYPAPSGTNNFDYGMADNAISNAHTTKDTYKATVYTVGVLDDADPTASITDGFNYGESSPAQQTVASNRYMHYVSSNYPDAASMQNGGNLSDKADPFNGGDSYYLSAGDADTLKNIFQQISNKIESGGSSTTLSSETVIKDIVAPAFNMPKNADVKLYTAESNGSTSNWKDREEFNGTVSIDVDTSSISVYGFSFKDYWCGNETINDATSFHDGKKLIIEFTVTPKDGFLGGNNVYTNGSAGVYENSDATEPVLTFDRPQVNVPIGEVAVTAAEKNVYLLGSVTAEQLKKGTTVKVGDVELDLSKANDAEKPFGLEPWQTEYVDISVKYYDADGETEITDLSNLTDDTTYTVEVTVKPNSNGEGASGDAATTESGSKQAKVNVFKPELTFKDSEVYYGDSVPTDYTGNKVREVWKHGNTLSTAEGVTMLGTAPELILSGTPDSIKIADGKINTKQDVPVDVNVKIGKTDVTDETTFVHNCDGKTCTVPDGKEFLLHVKTCQLTVTKKDGASDEPYVFDIYKDNDKYTEVTIKGNSGETICELPVGTYTIKEDTGWSWRFAPSYSDESVELSSTNTSGTITCTNTQQKHYWLNGFSSIWKNAHGASKAVKK